MSPFGKFAIGAIAVAAMAGVHQGPLGNGAAFIDAVETQARKAVTNAEVPGVTVTLGHHPLSRQATLSGPADAFQREGQGELPGLNDRVAAIDGVSAVRWADEPARFATPLIAEVIGLALIAYLLGLAASWLVWGRGRDEY